MSRIAAGFAEGAEQGQESSGKERDGRTAAGAAGGADDLHIQHAGQCGDAGSLQRRDIGQWPRALLALSGLVAGFVFDWKSRQYMGPIMYCVMMLSTTDR